MLIKTSDSKQIIPFIKRLFIPNKDSHKGQNGRVLIIGGSSLFHSASLWAAEVASLFVDIVHYASTKENNMIMQKIKTKWRNGIVVDQKNLENYIKEDDVVLLGTGMMRAQRADIKLQTSNFKLQEALSISDEGERTYYLTKLLLRTFPNKKWVIDAGALQMMDKEWLRTLKTTPIITPHQREFNRLFGINLITKTLEEKARIVQETAERFRCVILLKAIVDIISDGKLTYVVEGGNQGLTKGGTGDVLAGLVTAFYAHNLALDSAVLASFLLKKTADALLSQKGYWYNIPHIIDRIPEILHRLTLTGN